MTAPAATWSDTDILARTLYGEARGESLAGIQAVASVILNRQAVVLARPGRARQFGGPAIGSICRAPWQFSCWLESDPNFRALNGATIIGAAFQTCTSVARQAVAGQLVDATGGADHYCVTKIADRTAWARGRKPTVIIGAHSFYRLEG